MKDNYPQEPGYPSSSQLTKLQIIAISGLACTLASCNQHDEPAIPTGGVIITDMVTEGGVIPANRVSPSANQKNNAKDQQTSDKIGTEQEKENSAPLRGKVRIEPKRPTQS